MIIEVNYYASENRMVFITKDTTRWTRNTWHYSTETTKTYHKITISSTIRLCHAVHNQLYAGTGRVFVGINGWRWHRHHHYIRKD